MAKKVKEIELPLVDSLQHIDLFDKTNVFYEIPDYILNNLKHHLRNYQKNALMDLDWTQKQKDVNQRYNHLLFHMATGSGKTDVMAAIILYMYREFQYHNFLFVVNTNAVVSKTKDNLLNSYSSKYLYKQPINIDGLNITIKSVDKFPENPDASTIYIRFTTIQTLSNELNSTKENGLTYEELEQNKLIILADEAHHFSAYTKNKLTKTEQLEKSWENTLDRVRQCNKENRQFEFTATIDLTNEAIYNKYRDKVLFQYDLSKFIDDGYSKNVYRLQANNDDKEKMLNAILMSQYRKRISKELDIENFKPIILFKSNKIDISNEARIKFNQLIDELDVEFLYTFIQRSLHNTQSDALIMTYQYWLTQDMVQTILELKREFNDKNLINVNDSSKKGILEDRSMFEKLNTLEDANNPFRVIFAVAKLSEGWDVLNLYDIVRIGEQPITPAQTNSEAQLIGRGARYNPFIYENVKSYTRRFDNKETKYQLLERLYYHTINDPKYLKNLKNSLDKMQVQMNDDDDFDFLTTSVKDSFKKTNTYKYGNIYYNEVEEVPEEEYSHIKAYGIDPEERIEINLDTFSQEYEYNQEIIMSHDNTELKKVISFNNNNDLRIIKKAFSRNKFYRFNQLRTYIPTLKSLNEFITSSNWLGNIKLYARVSIDTRNINNQQKLKILDQYLIQLQRKIVKNYQKKRGTNRFMPIPVKQLVTDYHKKIPRSFNDKQITEIIRLYPMKKKNWFVYEDAIVDGLEHSLIELIGSIMDELQSQYKGVYLIRVDERNSIFKLHDFNSDIYHYEGFIPDFILYLEDIDSSYQIYIEPKGTHLLERDQWKEDLLEKIEPENIVILGEDNNVKLYGVKFYTAGNTRNIIQELEQKNIIK